MSIARRMQQAAAGSAGAGPEPSGWTDPDLANASYDSVSFSVAGQETDSSGLFFKPDGTKLYIIGVTGDDVNEYDLSTAWDVSTATYVQNFSIASQDGIPTGLFFSEDGLRFYFVGLSGVDVNQYSLSSSWDISSASFVQSFSVSAQETGPSDVFFKPDGTKMYVIGYSGDDINEYSLSTAWDISTAAYVQLFSIASQEVTPRSLFIAPTGESLFIVGSTNDTVFEYSLSTAWDISSASYASISFPVSAQGGLPRGIYFKPDGSKLFVLQGFGNNTIYQYSTAAAAPAEWTDPDLGNASYDSVSFSVSGQDTIPSSLSFKPDGSKMYVAGTGNDVLYQYSLSTDWDVSSASYDSVSFSVSSQAGQPKAFFKPDGTKFYVADNGSDAVYEYVMSTAWDLSTASYNSVSFSVSSQDATPQGFTFKADGTKMYVVGFSNTSIFQYSLSTAWDLSSASYDAVSFNFSSQETQGRILSFNPDGTKMFFIGTANDTVYQYSLSTAWDVSSASYDSVSFSVTSQESIPLSLVFKADGSKMYVVGSANDTIYQYSTA